MIVLACLAAKLNSDSNIVFLHSLLNCVKRKNAGDDPTFMFQEKSKLTDQLRRCMCVM